MPSLRGYVGKICDSYGNVMVTFPIMEAKVDRSAMSCTTTVSMSGIMTDELASIFREPPPPSDFSLSPQNGWMKAKIKLSPPEPPIKKEECIMLNDPLIVPRTTVLEKLQAKLASEKSDYETRQAAEAEEQAAQNAKVAAVAEAFPHVVRDALHYYGGAYAQSLQQTDPAAYLREQGYTPAAAAAEPFSNPSLERMISVLESATNETLSLTPSDDLYRYL